MNFQIANIFNVFFPCAVLFLYPIYQKISSAFHIIFNKIFHYTSKIENKPGVTQVYKEDYEHFIGISYEENKTFINLPSLKGYKHHQQNITNAYIIQKRT